MIDGNPIVCIVTDPDQARLNRKTQRVIQTYILHQNIDPIEAIQTGQDDTICGDCIHRENTQGRRSCYVQVWSAPRNVWLAYKRGKYRKTTSPKWLFAQEIVRLGAYGDPAAVPIEVWDDALEYTKATIGYTHQWRRCPQGLKQWTMASVEKQEELSLARKLGWRTFRVRLPEDDLWNNEIMCPASEEAGHKTNCAECRACGGLNSKAKCDIAIVVHGDKGKMAHFKDKIEETDDVDAFPTT